MNSRWTLTFASLALAVTLAACGSNSASPTAPSPSPSPSPVPGTQADVMITITGQNGNQSFSPNPANITAGQTVAWTNADSVVHDVTADDGSFTTGNIAPGATSARIMIDTAGAVPYHCSIHPSMVGSLNVTQ